MRNELLQALHEPLRWKSPKTIFVNSMSDLFQTGVGDDYVTAVARVMEQANWHTYQVLTKRSDRMRDLLNTKLSWAARLSHVWWGVSVEDRKYGVPRIEHLQQTNAAVRFLSIEPLLEDLGEIDLRGIHWVIVGGESGAGCRPLKEAWVVSLRDQCRRARVPFFFKQWGGFPKKVAGRTLKGKTWDAMPSRPEVEVLGTNERELLIRKAAAVAARWTAPERERSIASAP